LVLTALLLLLVLSVREGHACTAFCADDGGKGALVGKSYDWDSAEALVYVNPSGLHKRGLVLDGSEVAQWVSRYSSVTFNQYGREFPNGGMNEAGLVVEVLWLSSTEDEPADERPAVNELQWVQRVLDTCAELDEVEALLGELRISSIYGTLHYFVCDAKANCAVLEFVDGKRALYRGDALPAKALTNDDYPSSLAALSQVEGFGGRDAVPSDKTSLSRFARTAAGLSFGTVEAAFEALDSVRVTTYTKWQIVYDLEARQIHYRTTAQPSIKWVKVDEVKRSCAQGAVSLDIDTDASGDVSALFEAASLARNVELLDTVFKGLEGLPPGASYLLSGIGASYSCGE
jgi:choloylglycine hydrolase